LGSGWCLAGVENLDSPQEDPSLPGFQKKNCKQAARTSREAPRAERPLFFSSLALQTSQVLFTYGNFWGSCDKRLGTLVGRAALLRARSKVMSNIMCGGVPRSGQKRWWRRWELNPRPKMLLVKSLHT